MSDWPVPRWPVLNTVTPYSVESAGLPLRVSSTIQNAVSGVSEGANVVAYWPFLLYEPATIVKLSYIVGATAGANVDLGVYDAQKNRLVNSGSTAQGSINTIQTLDVTDTAVSPGLYFMAITFSNGTGTYLRHSGSDDLLQIAVPFYVETTGAFGLPATAAFAQSTAANVTIPLMAVHFDTLV